jgi:16S rRNA (adenine1518-N6/adenine1519-N6)-dimethyltransferase
MIKKKSLGQHFLHAKAVLSDIIDASDVTPDEVVVEIGPGEGALTSELLKWTEKVIAIEKDRRLIPILEEKFKKEIKKGKLEILEKDILEFDPQILSFYKDPYKVVANIPYYITGQILRMFLESSHQPESMTLLVQKEVADRIMTRDGKESLLSLSVKVFGEPKYVRTVGKGSFTPPPNVDSAVLVVQNISKKRLEGVSEKVFFEVIHAGFAHKRKQLLPNLTTLYTKETLLSAFSTCNISPKIRAEDINLTSWIALCKALENK